MCTATAALHLVTKVALNPWAGLAPFERHNNADIDCSMHAGSYPTATVATISPLNKKRVHNSHIHLCSQLIPTAPSRPECRPKGTPESQNTESNMFVRC